MEMNDQNNYASQISGWVNQSIIPNQQIGLQQSGQSLQVSKNSNPGIMQNTVKMVFEQTTNSSQNMNYNVEKIYKLYASRQSAQKAPKSR